MLHIFKHDCRSPDFMNGFQVLTEKVQTQEYFRACIDNDEIKT